MTESFTVRTKQEMFRVTKVDKKRRWENRTRRIVGTLKSKIRDTPVVEIDTPKGDIGV